jgi:hypothetical protein
LGLEPPYTAEQAEQAFREAAKTAHPDHGGDPRRFVELQQAYEQALALVKERRARRPAPARLPPIPAPRRRRARPAAPGTWTLALLYWGLRAVAVVAVSTAVIAGGLGLWHRRQNTAERVDSRAADVVARFGGSVTWDGNNASGVSLRGVELTVERLEVLRRFGMLERLDLGGTTLDDGLLVQIMPLLSVRELDLTGTRITDTGLALLKSMPGLERLVLDGTRISDDGLAWLDAMPRLQRASVRGTAVTLDGIARARNPERYVWDAPALSAANADRATSLADFLPERQWAVQELRSALAGFGLLSSEALREASRIDLAAIQEAEALSNKAVRTELEPLPLEDVPAAPARRVRTLADLLSIEGLEREAGSSGRAGPGPAPVGRAPPLTSRKAARAHIDLETEQQDKDRASAEFDANLAPIFGRRQRGAPGDESPAWIVPRDVPDARFRPGALALGRLVPLEPEAEEKQPALFPLLPSRERGMALGPSTPKLDLPVTKRRDFYYLGELGKAARAPRKFQEFSGSTGMPQLFPGGIGVGGLGIGGFGPGPFDPLGTSATSHLDALRKPRTQPEAR